MSNLLNSANGRGRKAAVRTIAKQMTKIFAALSPREEMLLRLSFGIGSDADYTLSEIGRRFSLPPQRIRQLQRKAFGKLRQASSYFDFSRA
jgi:RNA polymerase primary sigma factor